MNLLSGSCFIVGWNFGVFINVSTLLLALFFSSNPSAGLEGAHSAPASLHFQTSSWKCKGTVQQRVEDSTTTVACGDQ